MARYGDERDAVEPQGGAVGGDVGEGVAIAGLDVAVGAIDEVEASAECGEGGGVGVAGEEGFPTFDDFGGGEAPVIAELEAGGDVGEEAGGGLAGAEVQGGVVNLQDGHPAEGARAYLLEAGAVLGEGGGWRSGSGGKQERRGAEAGSQGQYESETIGEGFRHGVFHDSPQTTRFSVKPALTVR